VEAPIINPVQGGATIQGLSAFAMPAVGILTAPGHQLGG